MTDPRHRPQRQAAPHILSLGTSDGERALAPLDPLAHDLYMIALGDDSEFRVPTSVAAVALAAATVAQLVLDGVIVLHAGGVHVTATPGHRLFTAALADLRDYRHDPRGWLRCLALHSVPRISQDLADRDLLQQVRPDEFRLRHKGADHINRRNRLEWVLYHAQDNDGVLNMNKATHATPIANPRDALLACLADACGLLAGPDGLLEHRRSFNDPDHPGPSRVALIRESIARHRSDLNWLLRQVRGSLGSAAQSL